MKKSLIIIPLVVLITVVFCIAVFAASGTPEGQAQQYSEGSVIAVNGTALDAAQVLSGELQAAIDDCIAGGVIEILADCRLPSISLGANADGDAAKWVINGNGHTLTDSDNTKLDGTSHTSYFIEISNAIVVINDLTVKTYASGIRALQTYANITLNNVNVYAGGTVPGTEITKISTSSESTLKRYCFALYFRGAEEQHYDTTIDNISVRINGGEYKAIGADGTVMYIRGASVVVTDGTFVGEDCTFVAWVYNWATSSAGTKTVASATSSLSVHDGLFIRPVSGGAAVGASNPDAAVGGVIRVTHGGLFNAYGGTYVNCDGTVPDEGKTAPKSSVLYFGTGSTAGLAYIYGGEFYQLSEAGSTIGELIGHQLGTTGTLSDPTTMIDCTRATIYGGKFYVREGLPNSNIDAIVAAKADSSITSNDNRTVQRAAWSDFSVSRTDGLVAKSVYGKEYSDLCEIVFSYTGTQSSKSLKVVTAEGRTYYTSDLNVALNSMAGHGSTVYLIANLTTSSNVKVHARNIDLSIYGVGSTYELNFSGNTSYWQGLWFRAGNIKIDGKLKIKTVSTGTALCLGLSDTALRPISLTVKLGDVRFRHDADHVYKNVGVAEGSFTATSCKVDDPSTAGTAGYEISYKKSESYALPTPKPKIRVKTNLTLYSDLIVNFYIPVEGNKVTEFVIDGVKHHVEDAGVVQIDGAGYYKFSHTRMSPADAMAAVSFGCVYKSDAGYFDYTASSNWTLVKYASGIQNKETVASSKALVSAVVAYVKTAYEYFGSDCVSASELSEVTDYLASYPANIPESVSDSYGVDASQISSVVSAASFDLSTPSIKLLLAVADSTKPLKISVGGTTLVDLPAGHGRDTVAVSLRAYDLTKLITISSADLVGTYSLAKYYEDATELDPSQRLKDIILAMYHYGASALAYRSYVNGENVNYSIVYPASDAHAKEMAELVERYILEVSGISCTVNSDATARGEYEILIGKTSRAASSVSVPDGSFHVSYSGNTAVAVGNNDFYLDMAVLYMLENLVDETAGSAIFGVESGYSLTKAEAYSFSGYAKYTDIVSDTLLYDNVKKYSSSDLYSSGVTGYAYDFSVSDFALVSSDGTADAEILSIDSLTYTTLGRFVSITVNGGSVVHLRFDKAPEGSDTDSYGRFVGSYTGADGSYKYTLTMTSGAATLVGEHASYTFSYALGETSTTLTTGEMKNVQGAATDGTYAYFYITNSNRKGAVGSSSTNYGVVWKINPKTGAIIARGPVISVGHGNDMCFDPTTGMLLLAWGGVDSSLVTVIDPATLEPVEVIDLGGQTIYGEDGSLISGASFYALTYNAELGMFIGATSSSYASSAGSAFWLLSWDRVGEGSIAGAIDIGSQNYTKQGIDCDGMYIYHTYSTGSGANSRAVVRVFDYEGNLVRTFNVPYPDSATNTIEIETAFFIDGKLYASFNRGGTAAIVELAVSYNY